MPPPKPTSPRNPAPPRKPLLQLKSLHRHRLLRGQKMSKAEDGVVTWLRKVLCCQRLFCGSEGMRAVTAKSFIQNGKRYLFRNNAEDLGVRFIELRELRPPAHGAMAQRSHLNGAFCKLFKTATEEYNKQHEHVCGGAGFSTTRIQERTQESYDISNRLFGWVL